MNARPPPAKWERPTSSLPDSRRRRHCHLCGSCAQLRLVLSLHERFVVNVPTPMPTSTIRPREISDTISLFTGEGFSTRAEIDDWTEKETCDRRREHTLDHCPHVSWMRK